MGILRYYQLLDNGVWGAINYAAREAKSTGKEPATVSMNFLFPLCYP